MTASPDNPRSRLHTVTAVLWRLLFAYTSLIPFYYLQPVGFGLNATTLTVAKYLPAGLILILAALIRWNVGTLER